MATDAENKTQKNMEEDTIVSDLKFRTGQRIFHPFYGVGTVGSIIEKEVLGQKSKFTIFQFEERSLKLMKTADQTTIAKVLISKEEFPRVFEHVRNQECDILEEHPKCSSQRYNLIYDKIRSGCFSNMAKAIKELLVLKDNKKISTRERKLFKQASEVFLEAIRKVAGCDEGEAEDMMKSLV